MKKKELLEEQKRLEDVTFDPEKIEEWLKMMRNPDKSEKWLKEHNFDPKVWELARVSSRTPKDKEIMVGDYILKLSGDKLKFRRVSCIRKNRLFFNELRDRQRRRVVSIPYRIQKGFYNIVLRKHRYAVYGDAEEEIFFRGMRFSPSIHLRDEPKETWKEKCPFCGTAKNLTSAGGTEGGFGLRDFLYSDFCERCKCLLGFSYDVEDGPFVSIYYRPRIKETRKKEE